MRHGLRPTALAFGALALAMLAGPGTAHAASAPAIAGTGPAGAGPQVEKALFFGPGAGYNSGEAVIQDVQYRRRFKRRFYRRLPWWAYRYWRPRPRYYSRHYYYAPRYRYWRYGW